VPLCAIAGHSVKLFECSSAVRSLAEVKVDSLENNAMAKFELHSNFPDSPALQTYEGDYMLQEHEFVKIFKVDTIKGDRQVAAINLDKNQSVKEV